MDITNLIFIASQQPIRISVLFLAQETGFLSGMVLAPLKSVTSGAVVASNDFSRGSKCSAFKGWQGPNVLKF